MDCNRIYSPREEPLELLALSGNISKKDDNPHIHLHALVSSGLEEGSVYGGHLTKGCIVLSTTEIALCSFQDILMERGYDEQTKTDELFFDLSN
jgi:predicted DNA-binding protein with PD1-like motif